MFWVGFEKRAAEQSPEGHHVRRLALSNPVSAAIEAEKGKKMQAFGKAFKHTAKQGIKGLAIGGATGATLGALAGAASGGKVKPGTAALLGGFGGAQLGTTAGLLHGEHGAEGSKIHGMYSKHKK